VCGRLVVSSISGASTFGMYYVQYTPWTPTRRNCRVESRRRRRCEHNSQLAHGDCRRHDATRLAVGKSVQICRNYRANQCEFHRRRDSTRQLRRVGGVYRALAGRRCTRRPGGRLVAGLTFIYCRATLTNDRRLVRSLSAAEKEIPTSSD